jgi:hypothetical protein
MNELLNVPFYIEGLPRVIHRSIDSASGDSPIPATLSPLTADSSAKVGEYQFLFFCVYNCSGRKVQPCERSLRFQNLLPYYIKVHGQTVHPELAGWTFRR